MMMVSPYAEKDDSQYWVWEYRSVSYGSDGPLSDEVLARINELGAAGFRADRWGKEALVMERGTIRRRREPT